ncbi:hypothetical protein IKQ19_09535 [Candidatus Saccharibacteria bacterium]|nr:hypothetical protein [Candidatus Saccharibacteria bacterium]
MGEAPGQHQGQSVFNIQPSDANRYIAESHENVQTDLIITTKDKLENILLKHLKNVEKNMSWITPASLFVTLGIALVTTTFKSFEYVSADTIKAVFIILCVASFVWLIIEIVRACRKGNKMTIDQLINMIANHQEKK